MAGVFLCVRRVVDGANKYGFSALHGSETSSTDCSLLAEGKSYRISYPLTLGVGRDLSWLTTVCNWDCRKDAVESDGWRRHDRGSGCYEV